ncbi:hypothetical protein LOC71_10575 [Rhodopirellula sp. JC740]|uniref:Uncharacterized protein n=1 Tax=Rhodopirellula halodulae TaxID=2894198 RepID=A0ABS8NGP6_9BACT|nr:hypothetical protein [Rhodopirellula sp. JC740]MCC9642721.1 hypothetical protein [Rhodopirellula sp. JC740]
MSKYLVDISGSSNGVGAAAYGGRLEAYSFSRKSGKDWFDEFCSLVLARVGNGYLPVYRVADGEMRFLFGEKLDLRHHPLRSAFRVLKHRLLSRPWETSWGESYTVDEYSCLRQKLIDCIVHVSEKGVLGLYWNENGLNAFVEHNQTILRDLSGIGVSLGGSNYVPFHFVQGLVACHLERLVVGRNVVFVSSVQAEEQDSIERLLGRMGVGAVCFRQCSAGASLSQDYSQMRFDKQPDIVFVAAGIGSARVLSSLAWLDVPVIDIGSYIHVLSGRSAGCHAGFFVSPVS